MAEFTVTDAERRLNELIQRALSGEAIVIARSDGKRVTLAPIDVDRPTKPRRSFGAFKGKIRIDESFFDPLPDDELETWGRRDP